jgi:hypothetical protein
MIYSPEQDKFYAPEFKESYVNSSSWPNDGIDVSREVFQEFSATKDGYSRKFENGVFRWVEAALRPEDLANVERFWRDSELNRADEELNKVQDSDPKSVGTVTEWRQYRKDLRAWPDNSNFPDKNFRPQSPH